MTERALLAVEGLCVEYLTPAARVRVVDDVSFELAPGEVLGLAGESGSGKSTIAQALLRILPPPAAITAGAVRFMNQDVLAMNELELRHFRWSRISLVFQSAMNALNPVMRIDEQIRDTIEAHHPGHPSAAARRARELFELVGIDPARLGSYPHELSGGMRQRVVIAIALALAPPLIILDEPTTALDVVVQNEILRQISALQKELGFSVLFITHDLSLMLEFSTRIAILYGGRLVETAPARELFAAAKHPYTRGLLGAFPSLAGPRRRLVGIPGSAPDPRSPPSGCRFHPRCGEAFERCRTEIPVLQVLGPEQLAACHLHDGHHEPS